VPRARRLYDRDLLDAIEALIAGPYSGTAWRTSWATRDPLIGSTAGGRWHPENCFEALYTSTEPDGSLAEVYFHLSRAPVFSSAHVRLHRLRVETRRTLRLDLEMLSNLGVEADTYPAMQCSRTREIGAAAHFVEFDSLLVPSPRWPCLNLVLFLDRLQPDSLTVEEVREVNWPAWREEHKRS
jgi:RES domain